MILAGDIGGTKTLLALYEYQEGHCKCYRKQQFVSCDFETFAQVLDVFLQGEVIDAICIGVAGPVMNGVCNTTNLPWVLVTEEIGKQTQVDSQRIALLNDLEATAWGVLGLEAEYFEQLNPQGEVTTGNIAVLAAGTGLGEAIIVGNGDEYQVLATEGGHTDFAPNSEEEILLLRYLMEVYSGHVSYERIVSGEGLVNIYQFLKTLNVATINLETEKQMLLEDPAVVISQRGCKEQDILCVQALSLFCRIYGAEAGNLALKCLPYGGIILAGGIAAKNLSIMQQGMFLDGFLSKGRYRDVLARMSVKVCTNPEAALLGAVGYAKRLLR